MAGGQDGPPPAKKARLSFTNHIEILVGKDKKSFMVHNDLICARSPVFNAACSERWTTSSQKPIELPEDSAEIFDIYLSCVYRDKVDAGNIDSKLTDDSNESVGERTRANRLLARTYILADKFGDTVATNMIIDEIISFGNTINGIPYEGVIAEVVQKLSLDSPLLKLYVDYFVYQISVKGICRSSEKAILPEAFLWKIIEVKARLCHENRREKISKVFPFNYASRNKCRYHQHNDEHPKCADAQVERGAAKGTT